MTVSKRGRVPQTIKEAIQEQFSRMGKATLQTSSGEIS